MYRVVLLALLSGAMGQLRLPGRCEFDSLKYKPINDLSPFTGKTWYLAASLGSEWYGGDCPTTYARLHPENPKSEVLADRFFLKDGEKFQFSRPITKQNNYFRQNFNPYTLEETTLVDYYILDSDVENYGVVYACVQLSPDSRIVSSHVYTTQKNLLGEAVAKLDAFALQYPDLKQGPWKLHDHSKCSF